MRVRRAVVTGGAGFLGSHLCERLLQEGYEVVCLDDFCTGASINVEHLLENRRFRLIRADVTDYVHVSGDVDAVLHLASPASPIDYLQLPLQTLKVGSIGTFHCPGIGQGKAGPLPAGFDVGILRRPAGPSPARNILGQRQSGRPTRRRRRGQTIRGGDDDGVSQRAGR